MRAHYLTSGFVTFLEDKVLYPGAEVRVAIRLITPEAYPNSVGVGDVIEFGSGSDVFGVLRVEQVLDPVLLRS